MGSSFVVLIVAKVTAVVIGIGIGIGNIMPADQSDELLRTRWGLYLLFECVPGHSMKFVDLNYFSGSICAIISQVTILTLTLIKYRTAVRQGWSAVPIVALVVRDGILTFSILISMS